MKPSALIGLAGLAALALIPGVPAADDTSAFVAAICSAERYTPAKDGARKLVLIGDMGTGRFPITTKVPDAQAWFDYGVKLYHGYYHDDAKAAFKQAEEIDPACAMCAWGEAWARGPTLNFDVDKKEADAALALARKAQDLSADVTPREKALIEAMVARYATAGKDGSDEAAFVKAMDKVVADYPSDTAIADVAVHSRMIVARRNGFKGFEPAVAELEAILKRSPDDSAAIHYYIHATEFVGEPAKAEPYADKLAGLAPQASHLVHMAAHTFFRVGRYEDAAGVNAKALGVDGAHATAIGQSGELGGFFYYGHNLGFGLAGAMMAGDAPLSLKFADHVAVAYPDGKGDRSGGQQARAYMAYGRYAPDHALNLPNPGTKKAAPRIAWLYARGEAFAAKGDATGVDLAAKTLSGSGAPTAISRGVLQGRAAMLRNDPVRAIGAYEAAAKVQEKQFAGAMDPPPWWYPVRRSVAAAELKAGHLDAAAREAQASLKAWPHDPLALSVLARAEVGLGKTADAQAHMDEARKLWRGDIDKVPLDLI